MDDMREKKADSPGYYEEYQTDQKSRIITDIKKGIGIRSQCYFRPLGTGDSTDRTVSGSLVKG